MNGLRRGLGEKAGLAVGGLYAAAGGFKMGLVDFAAEKPPACFDGRHTRRSRSHKRVKNGLAAYGQEIGEQRAGLACNVVFLFARNRVTIDPRSAHAFVCERPV